MRDSKIMIRIGNNELELLDRAAKAQGLPTASWARMELLRTARGAVDRPAGDLASTYATERPELLSLFCGPGGLDEGFRQAGFVTKLAFDNDQECVNTFARNHKEAKVHKRDITELSLSDIKTLSEGNFVPTGVVGGPPCQSFSVSNVHQKDDDPRHSLPSAYAKLLKAINEETPISFFVFENVPGLLGERHVHRYERFKGEFAEAGFDINENILDAQNYGVPQVRPRVFIVGINRELHPHAEWRWPEPVSRKLTVRDTIGSLSEPKLNEKGADPSENPVHPNHWCMVPRSDKFKTKGALIEGQAWGRSFRTLTWDEPSWTVAYGNREVHVHPKGHRRLSIFEAMLLQSFPKNYVLTGNISAQTRLISEAVPPRMGWHLAVAIKRCLGI